MARINKINIVDCIEMEGTYVELKTETIYTYSMVVHSIKEAERWSTRYEWVDAFWVCGKERKTIHGLPLYWGNEN